MKPIKDGAFAIDHIGVDAKSMLAVLWMQYMLSYREQLCVELFCAVFSFTWSNKGHIISHVRGVKLQPKEADPVHW